MKVGCYDCGESNPEYERPRSVKTGMKNTVTVCKKCHDKWWKKHS